MRKKNCYLAAITAAILVLQTPALAYAAETGNGTIVAEESDTTETGNNTSETDKSETKTSGTIMGTEVGYYVADGTTLTIDSTTNGAGTDGADATLKINGDASSEDGIGVIANGGTIEVGGNASSETSMGAYAYNGSITVHGNAISNGNINVGAASASGSSGIVTVDKDAIGSDGNSGVNASNGGTVIVKGNVSSKNNSGVSAFAASNLSDNGGTVNVGGNVSSENGRGVSATYNSKINVDGNVSTSSDSNTSVVAGINSEVNVGGDVSSNSVGIIASVDSKVNVGGDVTTLGLGLAAHDDSEVNVVGNIFSNNGVGVQAYLNGEVNVSGNVSTTSTNLSAIQIDNTSRVFVGNDVTAGGESTSAITVNIRQEKPNNSYLVILGKITSSAPAIELSTIKTTPDSIKTEEDMANAAPDIVVNSIDTTGLNETLVTQKINYIINHDDGLSISGAKSYTANGNTYQAATAGTEVTITPNAGYTLSEEGTEGISLVNNGNGTYTITIPKGGNINLTALKQSLSGIGTVTSTEESEEETTITIEASAEDTVETLTWAQSITAAANASFTAVQKQVQEEVKSIPEDGTLEVESNSIVSFNQKTFEALAARPDVSVSVTYVFNGKKYKVVIPAGYPVMELLDENGYCGCLYLNLIFGSELIG